MKCIICYILLPIALLGCSMPINKLMLIKNNIKEYPVLSREVVHKNIDSNKQQIFKAIVGPYPGVTTTEFRLFMPYSPQYGGIKWADCPILLIKKLLKKNDMTLWVILKAKLIEFSADYQIDPEVDPFCVVKDSEMLGYYYKAKHTFKKEGLLPEK